MKIANRTVALGLGAAALAGVMACGGGNSNTDVKYPETTSAPVGSSTTTGSDMSNNTMNNNGNMGQNQNGTMSNDGEMATGLGTASPGSQTAGTSMATSFTDAQIAELASDVNQGEIEQARYAVGHAKNTQVVQFARHMLTTHTDIDQKMSATLQTQSIRPATSQLSDDLKSNGQQTLTTMRGKTGMDFDREYMDAQVHEHQEALDLLDNKLIPGAKNPQLKATLEDVRVKVASHLSEAQNIQNTLSTK